MKRSAFVSWSLSWALLSCSGGGPDPAAEMARQHEGDEPVATEAATAEPAMEVETQSVAYATVNGQQV